MEVWEIIRENLIEILTTVSVVVTIICRSAKPMNADKQAEWEERTAEKRIEQKRKRLERLREEDNEYANKMKSNLAEEHKLEKELGENA